MRKTVTAILFASICTLSSAAPPTKDSILTLLEVTKAESMIDQAYASVEQVIRQNIAQASAGRSLSDDQRRVIDAAPAKFSALIRDELSWAKMLPIYIGIYQETFDQAEVDGLIEFYRGPVGQSFISKMPAVLNRTMSVMQVQMQSLMPKMKQAMEDLVREARLQPKT